MKYAAIFILGAIITCPRISPNPTPPTTTTTTTISTPPITLPPFFCYIPEEDSQYWQLSNSREPQMLKEVMNAEKQVGSRCGEDPDETLSFIARQLRFNRICAGVMTDSVFVKNKDFYEEYHVVSYGNGCYTGNPYKNTWTHEIVQGKRCPIIVDNDHFVEVRISHIGGDKIRLTATPKYCGYPLPSHILPNCGTKCCTLGVDGGDYGEACEKELFGTPKWTSTGNLNFTVLPNPFNVRINSGSGTIKACGKNGCSNEISY